jgi:uncharacterized membrane protein YeaQ/YmgE (transglycosylase-associated protein family)
LNVISWILFGLVAGAIARLIVPGRQEIGCLATIAVGIVGALIGGLVGEVCSTTTCAFGGISARSCWPSPVRSCSCWASKRWAVGAAARLGST